MDKILVIEGFAFLMGYVLRGCMELYKKQKAKARRDEWRRRRQLEQWHSEWNEFFSESKKGFF